jgi:hypothetical protein
MLAIKTIWDLKLQKSYEFSLKSFVNLTPGVECRVEIGRVKVVVVGKKCRYQESSENRRERERERAWSQKKCLFSFWFHFLFSSVFYLLLLLRAPSLIWTSRFPRSLQKNRVLTFPEKLFASRSRINFTNIFWYDEPGGVQ